MHRVKSRNSKKIILEMFEQWRGLAVSIAVKYARKNHRADLQELIQEAFIALWNSARLYKPGLTNNTDFKRWASINIHQAMWAHLNNLGKFGAHRTISLNEHMGDEDEDTTLLDVLDYEISLRAEADGQNELFEFLDRVEKLIDACDTLTARERRIMRLRSQSFSNAEIAHRLRLSRCLISTTAARATRKMIQFLDDGIPATTL